LACVLGLAVGLAAGEPERGGGAKSSDDAGKKGGAVVAADTAAERAARRFLEACAASDWDTVRSLWTGKLDDRVKQVLGGLEVISVGQAEASRLFPGARFVPYEVRFKNAGRPKRQKLTLKPDKRTGDWVVDGGI